MSQEKDRWEIQTRYSWNSFLQTCSPALPVQGAGWIFLFFGCRFVMGITQFPRPGRRAGCQQFQSFCNAFWEVKDHVLSGLQGFLPRLSINLFWTYCISLHSHPHGFPLSWWPSRMPLLILYVSPVSMNVDSFLLPLLIIYSSRIITYSCRSLYFKW